MRTTHRICRHSIVRDGTSTCSSSNSLKETILGSCCRHPHTAMYTSHPNSTSLTWQSVTEQSFQASRIEQEHCGRRYRGFATRLWRRWDDRRMRRGWGKVHTRRKKTRSRSTAWPVKLRMPVQADNILHFHWHRAGRILLRIFDDRMPAAEVVRADAQSYTGANSA